MKFYTNLEFYENFHLMNNERYGDEMAVGNGIVQIFCNFTNQSTFLIRFVHLFFVIEIMFRSNSFTLKYAWRTKRFKR
ncbi:hypothetical protein BpHYR1_011960 [Brachionus plicatilis]|uniref:Uncharacterized protein n=1 Tax=Brachionus plicatilis TaxID=10195 RepID=A0A3M7PUH8_BRAPC|nr:hypothetical protein BpHYR1_011960 [Brachionus plicatilis]